MAKNYKNLNFNKKEDYLFALYVLIGHVYKLLKRYNRYQNDFVAFLNPILYSDEEYVDTEICEEWQDKFLSVSRELIKHFVDDVKTGFSYIMFRKMVNKTEYKLKPLDKSLEKELEELRDVRNWSFHLAQSDFVAMKEVFYKKIPKEFHSYVEYSFSPIRVSISKKTNKMHLASLFVHNERRIEIFQRLFNRMHADFEELLGMSAEIVEINEKPLEFLDDSCAAMQLSMAMQKRKYDGSDEAFEKITLQNLKHNA